MSATDSGDKDRLDSLVDKGRLASLLGSSEVSEVSVPLSSFFSCSMNAKTSTLSCSDGLLAFPCRLSDFDFSARPGIVNGSLFEGRRLEWKTFFGVFEAVFDAVFEAVFSACWLFESIKRGGGGGVRLGCDGFFSCRRRVLVKGIVSAVNLVNYENNSKSEQTTWFLEDFLFPGSRTERLQDSGVIRCQPVA